jgi:hypothetical protein
MYKTITIFRNIEDVEEFQKLYMKEILPRTIELPDLVHIDITSVETVNPAMAGPYDGMQYVVESYWETKEQLHHVLGSPEVAEQMNTALQKTPGELFFFTGSTIRMYADKNKNKEKQSPPSEDEPPKIIPS